jgi:5-methylcytosine-specific restriction protein A
MTDTLIFDRHRRVPDSSIAESGRKICRWCRCEITAMTKRGKPDIRRTFCSNECGEMAAVASSSSYARFRVFDRDSGVCARCGMDTEYIKMTLNPLLKEAADTWREPWRGEALREIVAHELEALGFSPRVASGAAGHRWAGALNTHLWEADHIVPVVEGGGGCGLENLRTLCRACHHKETKALAGRRAKTTRIQKKQERHAARMRAKQQRRLW